MWLQLTGLSPALRSSDAGLVDWSAVIRSGQKLVPTGPALTPAQASAAVADLRDYSRQAELIVRETTGLGEGLPVAEAEVVDRRHWIEATAAGMAVLTEPLAERLSAKLTGPAGGRAKSLAGSQLGAVLAFLSGRVLGQFDPVSTGGREQGRLLLVAPNIVKVEREITADPADFRMWVCLHESTHRLQFTAVSWLEGYFRSLVAEFGETADVDPPEMLRRALSAIRGSRTTFIEAMQSPQQRVVFDKMMALMTLLEGHADHVMDAVGPAVVPTVASIRAGFTTRRNKTRGPVDRLIRALLGMDMKLAQYTKGAAFVAAVVDRVGMAEFNRIWTSVETLPTRAETTDPDAWITRVLG